MRTVHHLALGCSLLALAACGADSPTGVSTSALSTYQQYQDASAGRVWFSLDIVQKGSLSEIASRPVNELVGVPDHWVRMQERGTELVDVVRELRDPTIDEWSQAIDLRHFDEIGRPVADATYQLFNVRMNVDGQLSEHKSLEVCWADQGSCVVMDPVVMQLGAFAETRQELIAKQWKPLTTAPLDFALGDGERKTQAGVCTLNSHPTWYGITYTWAGRTVNYKNIFGVTLVSKYLAGQQVGISCYVSSGYCRSSGNGYSWASSCSATLGYNCSCKNSGFNAGSTQPATRAISETKCTHALAGNTSISFSWQGSGASLAAVWNTNGSVDSSGGQAYDACSWH